MLENILNLNIYDFFSVIQTIRNGYKDKDNQLHFEEDYDFYDYDYVVSSPQEVMDQNCGWCFDIANLIHVYCDYNNLNHKSIYVEYDDHSYYISQIQVFLEYENQWYFAIDNSIREPFGMLAYPTKQSCIQSFLDDFTSYLDYQLKENYDQTRLKINEFQYMFQKGDSFETCLELVRKKFN